MNIDDFNVMVYNRLARCREVLTAKNREYASGGDKLYNFKAATGFGSEVVTPEEALWGMLRKHLVSVADMVRDTKFGKIPSDELMDAKITDSIDYLLLLEGLFRDRAAAAKFSRPWLRGKWSVLVEGIKAVHENLKR